MSQTLSCATQISLQENLLQEGQWGGASSCYTFRSPQASMLRPCCPHPGRPYTANDEAWRPGLPRNALLQWEPLGLAETLRAQAAGGLLPPSPFEGVRPTESEGPTHLLSHPHSFTLHTCSPPPPTNLSSVEFCLSTHTDTMRDIKEVGEKLFSVLVCPGCYNKIRQARRRKGLFLTSGSWAF